MKTQTPLIKIAFFDAKPYDIESFDKIQKDFGFKIPILRGISRLKPPQSPRGFKWSVCL